MMTMLSSSLFSLMTIHHFYIADDHGNILFVACEAGKTSRAETIVNVMDLSSSLDAVRCWDDGTTFKCRCTGIGYFIIKGMQLSITKQSNSLRTIPPEWTCRMFKSHSDEWAPCSDH